MSLIANLKPVATRSIGRAGLLLQKYSPEILTTVGIAGVVTAGVMASRATLKLTPILEKKRTNVEVVRDLEKNPGEVPYEGDPNKDVAKIYIRTGLELVKLYGPSVTLAAGGVACILGAHGIMRRRNVAIVAAAKAIESAFSDYRERIAEEIGEEREREIYTGQKVKEVKNEKTGETELQVTEYDASYSVYSRFFDQMSSQWENNAEYNRSFLAAQEAEFTRQLHARGHVTLNDVYDALDLPRTKEGQVVGWAMGNGGDEFVDFGIFREVNGEVPEQKRMFVNGLENAVRLDFNVDGFIYDKI